MLPQDRVVDQRGLGEVRPVVDDPVASTAPVWCRKVS